MALEKLYNWFWWEMQNATMAASGATSIDENGVLTINSTVDDSRDILGRPVNLRGGDVVEFDVDAIGISGTSRIMTGLGSFSTAGTDAMGAGAESKLNVEVGIWKHYHLKYKVPAHVSVERGWVAVGTGAGVTGKAKFKNPVFRINGDQAGFAPKNGGFQSTQGGTRCYNVAVSHAGIELSEDYNAANTDNQNICGAPVGSIPSSFTLYGNDAITSGFSLVNLNSGHGLGANFRIATSSSGIIGDHAATENGTTIGEIHAYGDDGSGWAEAGCIQFKQCATAGDGYVPTHIYFKNSTEDGFKTQFIIWGTTENGGVTPGSDGLQMLGSPAHRWSQLYASTATVNTSDSREKDNIENPSDALMRAWGKVGFKVFQMRDAIAKKGASVARLHVGVIAQEVRAAFASEGLDASRYGLFCYDEWDDEYETETVVDAEERIDDETGEVVPAQTHVERRLVVPAGNRYGIRYEEALALECAYQRWLGEKRDAKIAELEARLNEISGNGSASSGASPDNL